MDYVVRQSYEEIRPGEKLYLVHKRLSDLSHEDESEHVVVQLLGEDGRVIQAWGGRYRTHRFMARLMASLSPTDLQELQASWKTIDQIAGRLDKAEDADIQKVHLFFDLAMGKHSEAFRKRMASAAESPKAFADSISGLLRESLKPYFEKETNLSDTLAELNPQLNAVLAALNEVCSEQGFERAALKKNRETIEAFLRTLEVLPTITSVSNTRRDALFHAECAAKGVLNLDKFLPVDPTPTSEPRGGAAPASAAMGLVAGAIGLATYVHASLGHTATHLNHRIAEGHSPIVVAIIAGIALFTSGVLATVVAAKAVAISVRDISISPHLPLKQTNTSTPPPTLRLVPVIEGRECKLFLEIDSVAVPSLTTVEIIDHENRKRLKRGERMQVGTYSTHTLERRHLTFRVCDVANEGTDTENVSAPVTCSIPLAEIINNSGGNHGFPGAGNTGTALATALAFGIATFSSRISEAATHLASLASSPHLSGLSHFFT